MKKFTFLIFLVFVYITFSDAQNIINSKTKISTPFSQKDFSATKYSYKLHPSLNTSTLSTSGCDTLMPASFAGSCIDSLSLYNFGVLNDSGYIAGQNVFGFSAKAEKFHAATIGFISDVMIFWGAKIGTTGNTSVSIYTVGTNNAPNSLLGTSNTITKVAIDTSNLGVNYNNKYHFSTPVPINSDFFINVSIPTTFTYGSDELGMVTENISCSALSGDTTGWFDFGSYGWFSYKYMFAKNFDLMVFPVFCSSSANMNEISLSDNLLIYPNPTTDNLTIETGDLRSTIYELRIEDVVGNTVLEKNFNNKANIDISALSKGMYFVEVKTEKGVAVKKFIKE